jgi:site-specific DNA-methyltransferase (adenine-specific)
MIEINKVYNEDCLIGMKKLADKSVSLIIADFPYFEVKGKFDFVWKDFSEFLAWVELCAKEFKRVLADNGTLLVYGHAKKIAYKQVIFDKYFNLENNLVWQKIDCQTQRIDFTQSRVFAPVTERILMYASYCQGENDWKNNNATVYYEGFEPFRMYLRDEIKKVGIKKVSDILKISERAIGHWTCKSQWYFPSQENTDKLKKLGIFKDIDKVRCEFDKVRCEFGEKHRRPFNNAENKYSDVLRFSQEVHITKNYKHPTQKPPKLSKVLIETCSRENDLILVPFAGSGVECIVAMNTNRNFLGFELDKTYYKICVDRIEKNRIDLEIKNNVLL